MCGLFGGFAATLMKTERETIGDLGLMNWFRGKDSAGHFDLMASPPKDTSKCMFNKSTDSILDYIQEEWPDSETKRWSKGMTKIIAGHARAATKGEITVKNAHPFAHGDIIGMHNGTIHGSFKNSKDFGTDSEALLYNISQVGIKEALEEANSSATTIAYALVWVDLKEHTLNFIRNADRPLVFAQPENKDVLYWNSEAYPMGYVLSRGSSRKWNTKPLDLDMHYCWDISKGPTVSPVETEIKPKPKTYPSYGGFGAHEWGEYSRWAEKREEAKRSIPEKFPKISGEKLDLSYLKQYSASKHTDFYRYFDSISLRWFSEWGHQRLSESRVIRLPSGNSSSAIGPDDTTPTANSSSSELNDPPFEPTNFFDKMKWTVFGGKEVSYSEWLKATKPGCCYCSNTLVNNSDIFWAQENEPLCDDCCEKVLNCPDHDIRVFFGLRKDEIKEFMRTHKKRLDDELNMHMDCLKKQSNEIDEKKEAC